MTEHSPHHIPPPDNIYDVTFIGAGPSALFGSFYAGMRKMSCKLIDMHEHIGGQLIAMYPEKLVFDSPAIERIFARDLIRQLEAQASHWNPKICLNEKIHTLKFDDIDKPLVLESDKGTHQTRTLIIAAGQGAMNPQKLTNEKLNKHLKPFENKNIFYSVKNKNRFLNKRLLIVGGGDSAFEWALGLKDYAKEVTHIHRSDRYKAELSTVAEVQHSKLINFKPFHELKSIKVGDGFEGATIFDNRDKQETTLDLDYILLLLGFDPKEKLGPIKDWGLDLIKEEINGELVDKYIQVNERQETYIPGVYAIGDIAKHPSVENMGLIATGFGQAPVAVGYAYVFIHPGASVKPGHSSNLKL